MAWFSGKVSLGNFPDLAGAVNKISESVKNIEKNFDTALGFEEKAVSEDGSSTDVSGLWPSAMSFTGQKDAVDPAMLESSENIESSSRLSSAKKEEVENNESAMSSMGQKDAVDPAVFESSENIEYSSRFSSTKKEEVENNELADSTIEKAAPVEEENEETIKVHVQPEPFAGTGAVDPEEVNDVVTSHHDEVKSDSQKQLELSEPIVGDVEEESHSSDHHQLSESSEKGSPGTSEAVQEESVVVKDEVEANALLPLEQHNSTFLEKNTDIPNVHEEGMAEEVSYVPVEDGPNDSQVVNETGEDVSQPTTSDMTESDEVSHSHIVQCSDETLDVVPELVSHEDGNAAIVQDVSRIAGDHESDNREQRRSSGSNLSDITDSVIELEKVKREMKMMEAALQGAARQAQAKADEIARMMTENEQLKAVVEDLKRKSNEAEIESLREEYHQRVSALERKAYALTKERDTLRREQNRKSSEAALLKEKDEIITQILAEGAELSKKQAAQEGLIRNLRKQVRELEEEKKGLTTKLQVEESKVESIRRDKSATEKLLEETVERHQAELATQKEYYTNALNAAKEAEALAEARANTEAKTELESRLREAEERETMLVQALEELRQTLTRKEQQAVFREDMLRRDIEDLQKRYQASERRCEELITQVPESTRPLLRQIEAMQETTARRAEAWVAVERSLNSRLQEAEAKAAAAEERERSVNERLSQTLSRINVLEAQISCLRAEQTQLSRSLEKERQRASENRQEYLALKEESDTHEGRVNQLEEEMKELKRKHKQELQEVLTHRELLQQDIDREKAARLELEKTSRLQSSAVADQSPILKNKSVFENGSLTRRLSSASSLSSMEESFYLQASLDSSDGLSERRIPGETTMSPYYLRSMTPNAFEAALRQKEGELASYMSRLASMESIRDSLAEELVKMTEQCEKLRSEASMLPGIRAELEALRRRHSAALELMGERDEELEELRADIVDLKEMYREQVNMLVNQIQVVSSSGGAP